MDGIKNYIGQEIEVEISGKTNFAGILIDLGLDMMVIFDGRKYLYIPLIHLQSLKERIDMEEAIQKPTEKMPIQDMSHAISYRKTLMNAKGQFIEIFVTGNRSIHGYITSVLNDYLAFYSPIYKMMFISMHHLKWLRPYENKLTPYTLSNEDLPVVPANIPLARSFEEQLQKHKNQLLVFDMGDNPNKVGLLKSLKNNLVELVTASGETIFWKLAHLKSVHMP